MVYANILGQIWDKTVSGNSLESVPNQFGISCSQTVDFRANVCFQRVRTRSPNDTGRSTGQVQFQSLRPAQCRADGVRLDGVEAVVIDLPGNASDKKQIARVDRLHRCGT